MVKNIQRKSLSNNSPKNTEECESDLAMPVRTLIVKSMQEAIALINKGCEIFCSNSNNWELSSTIKSETGTIYHNSLYGAEHYWILQPYCNLLSEKKETKHTSN
jgi:hypothetical protein